MNSTHTKILKGIEEKLEQNPDLRFNQLLYILYNIASTANNNFGRVEDVEGNVGYDMFNMTDELFLKHLNDKF